MKSLTDLLIEQEKENSIYFSNYLKYAKEIKKEAQKFLKKVRVFIFGSILNKGETPRDIDILIVSQKLKKNTDKVNLRIKIWKKIGLFSPFELHFVTPDEYKNWYRFFLRKCLEV